jgi:hypothetical protein
MPNRQKPILHSLSSLVGSQNVIGQPSPSMPRGSPVNADLQKPMNKIDVKANPREPAVSENSSLNDIYFNI